MTRRRILSAFVVVAATVVAGVALPDVASAATVVNPVVQLTPQPLYVTWPVPAQKTFYDSGLGVESASTTRGVMLSSGGIIVLGVRPPSGEKLRPGSFYWRDGGSTLTRIKSAQPGTPGLYPISILDVDSTASGAITRFDAVIEGIGEIRFGQAVDRGTAVLGSQNVVFPQQFVGSLKSFVPETIHNRGTKTIRIGKPEITGPSASSFTVSSNTCGTALKAKATCTFKIGFSPKTHGPLSALLRVAVAGTARSVNLTGSANLGTSSIMVSGENPVSKGVTTTDTAGVLGMSARGNTSYILFDTFNPAQQGGGDRLGVTIQSDDGSAPVVGTRQTGPDEVTNVSVGAFGVGATTTGTLKVDAFETDKFGTPNVVKMSFTEEYYGDTGVMHGSLLWQYRQDTTRPAPPTRIAAHGRTITWTPSASSDVAKVVARLVTGSGADATPQSGIPLIPSKSSVTLPAPRHDQKYTVVLFAVDTSGNVSAMATKNLPS